LYILARSCDQQKGLQQERGSLPMQP
jgi:hypothetical protein